MTSPGADSGDRWPDRWLVLRIPLPPEPSRRERVVDLLMEGDLQGMEPRGVEEREDGLVVYVAPPSPSEGGVGALVERLRHGLRQVGETRAADGIQPGWQAHEAWAEHWRKGFGTRRITGRIVVTPSWEPVDPAPGEVVIVVDPGMAFGTSEHPTTRGCLRLLDGRVESGTRVADVGAGSGILSMACAFLGARFVLALELDPWACTAARENVDRNGLTERVRVLSRSVGADFLPGEEPFDGIVANIEAGILRPLVPGFARGLRPGGWLILSGILDSEAADMRAAAEDAGFRFIEEDREGEWWSAAFAGPPGAAGAPRPDGSPPPR
ncbi:MAG: 50S ribosomal protein L11 methyltransferase [Gemmatimonadales bacterium]|nr:MAG: 50S ribosomal protein L11 methyltransferase [Gemmatimonadales bacterium]